LVISFHKFRQPMYLYLGSPCSYLFHERLACLLYATTSAFVP
jgi:hypothetical protein